MNWTPPKDNPSLMTPPPKTPLKTPQDNPSLSKEVKRDVVTANIPKMQSLSPGNPSIEGGRKRRKTRKSKKSKKHRKYTSKK